MKQINTTVIWLLFKFLPPSDLGSRIRGLISFFSNIDTASFTFLITGSGAPNVMFSNPKSII